MGRALKATVTRTRPSKPAAVRRARAPKRVPAATLNLTSAERALLHDPEWVTEDDADFLVGYRRRRQPTITFEKYLRRRNL